LRDWLTKHYKPNLERYLFTNSKGKPYLRSNAQETMPFNLLFSVRVSQQEIGKLPMLWINAITNNLSYLQRWPLPSFATNEVDPCWMMI
jgi:Leucine-rich repeat (LRR) protein